MRKFVIKLAVSTVLMAIILYKIDLEHVFSELAGAQIRYLLLACFLLLIKYWISAIRWKLLLARKYTKVGILELTRLYMIGAFFNNFLPTNVGGDAVKIAKLRRRTGDTIDSMTSVLVERFTGVVALVFISSGALLYFYRGWAVLLLMGLAAGTAFAFFVLHQVQSIHHLLERFYASLMAYRLEKKWLVYAFLIGFLAQAAVLAAQYTAFLALELRPPVLWTLFTLPMIALAAFLPISVNGVGIEESLFIFFFGTRLATITAAQALAVCFAYRIVKIAVSLAGGLLYAFETEPRP